MAFIDLKSFTQETVLSFHNICYRVKEEHSFLFRRKTFEREIFTNIRFLDVLAARNDPSGLSGDILINGAPRPANFKYNSGFVVQDDLVLGTPTVRENLAFSAALRLPTTMTKHEKDERIKVVIEELGLDEVADSKVRSGEERKKTSIAMGLITDPSILFLDEPTTGLDFSTANAIVSLLKNISEQGRTIIFSFHQPQHSIFKLFDSLTILASGKLMYHGPAQKALEYFKSAGYHCEHLNNPLDFFLDVINGDSPAAVTAMQEEGGEANETEQLLIGRLPVIKGLAQFYSKSPFYRETETELERLSGGQHSRSPTFKEITYVTTFCHQFRWIFWRSFRNLMGRLKPWIVEIFIIFMLGLLIGVTFLGLKNDCTEIQNKAWSLYVLTVFQCVTSVSAREIFLMERNLFILEYISGYYRVSSYFLGKLLFEFLFRRFFPSFIFTGILYWILGLKRGITAFLITMITTLMVAYSTTAMILAIGTRENAASGKTRLVTIYFVFMLVFLGMSLNFETMAPQLSWLQYFSIPHYGYMALQHNEFLEQKFCSGPNTTMSNCRPSFLICTGEEFLIIQGLSLSPWSLWINHLGLACMMFVFLVIAYLKMLFLKKHS
ncbi:broad substrate specificity ATP-binding cassette transporter ABCG2-like isoform X1 [Marmota marmota marmota]|uniref:broad substrate specificity ATP-binding cassette transporter ABCG2-like isoform X1 n=2 Tax=Marmota marmota marmota TaxID=9994 RepID=UPI0020921AA9|nr:broad substrate specificity ATP-binding cassette transporter ABCG2-like isoform X1 [Marmota marmota marmota]XP_048669545.1 broad substrate specificity ATP-binding cassette transporter ABCG2-like isoform X1 [Marmota marmota marmota]XP_048669546.1 broad substrate specificity ATP-binding cassette transporter ABCG2-like isoform X1 [Marmota marmota marmota]XP_048669547.1 broad substrate specificity ATP-binding cassette transporter ABCG2-like isoform X1 [Marmota marmota marmota]